MRVYIVVAKASDNETDEQPGFIRGVFTDPSKAAGSALRLQRSEKSVVFDVQPWEVQSA